MEKHELIINQLSMNMSGKIAQLEGEKAVLQIELYEKEQELKELKERLEKE